eukprot:GFUD01023926.1.p1 GENE.GFUD01023926.1~~GFUD01023926.1.p1  ORF type:complete len:534 (+),score=146.13 GFUD01023926.1:56-1657(+)
MFGQSGGGGGPWQGVQRGSNNMDAETLAQTLVSVAQNLISSQAQSSNAGPNYSTHNRGRPNPWSSSAPQTRFNDQQREQVDKPNYSGSGQGRGRGMPDYYDQQQNSSGTGHGSRHRSGSGNRKATPKPLMGMGILGAAPEGDYRTVREPSFVIGDNQSFDQGWGDNSFHNSMEDKVSSGQEFGGGFQQNFGAGFGIGEDNFVEKVNSKGANFETEKSRKNYRPKIKEDGCPPKYSMSDFEHLSKEYLRCTMCNKDMWNSVSFVNHLKGNAHNKTVDDVAAKEASKVADVRKQITDLLRKDTGKPRPGDRSGKCNMCGVKVVRDMMAHRKTDYHQKLKKFIHPHCTVCDADFEDRSDWYYHKFSAEHLSNLEVRRDGIEYDPMSVEELEKFLKHLEGRNGYKGKDRLNNEKTVHNVDKNEMFKEMKAFAAKHSAKINKKKDDEDVIIMEDEDLVTEKNIDLSKNNSGLLGTEFIKPVNGMFCKLCKKFFGSGDAAIAEHCKSQFHTEKCRNVQPNNAKRRNSAAEFFSSPKKKK